MITFGHFYNGRKRVNGMSNLITGLKAYVKSEVDESFILLYFR